MAWWDSDPLIDATVAPNPRVPGTTALASDVAQATDAGAGDWWKQDPEIRPEPDVTLPPDLPPEGGALPPEYAESIPREIRSEGQGPAPREESFLDKMRKMAGQPQELQGFTASPQEITELQANPPVATGVAAEIEKPIRAGVEYVKGFVPQTWEQAAEMAGVPTDIRDVEGMVKFALPQSRLIFDLPKQAQTRYEQVQSAEETPPWSQERWTAGLGTAADIAGLGALIKGAPQMAGEPALIAKIKQQRKADLEASVKGAIEDEAARYRSERIAQELENAMPTRPQVAPERISPETGEAFLPEGEQPYASQIPEPTRVPEPKIRPPVGKRAPLRQQGETPETRPQPIEAVIGTEGVPAGQAGQVEPTIPLEDLAYAGEAPRPGVSKIGQSIEAKAVEAKLTQGFGETAGYDPITIADQAQRAASVVQDVPQARAIIRGEAPLPEGLRGTSLITAMEEHLLKKPDAQVAYELANSPLTSATSVAAQEMRLMQERVPDSLAAKFQEIRAARAEGAKLRGENTQKIATEISREVTRQASKRPTWEAFIQDIAC